MGQVMRLIDLVENLDSFDDEAIIYATEPWTQDSSASVQVDQASGESPRAAPSSGMTYFLEVFIARDFLEDWRSNRIEAPSLEEQCERLVKYALHDA